MSVPLAAQFSTALVVDDDPLMREIASATLATLGIANVHSASSGIEALATLDNEAAQADLILCDLQMPEMDGMAFLRALGSRDFGGAIVMLSGMDAGVLALAERLGRTHHLDLRGVLRKPLNKQRLIELLSAAGHAHGPATRAARSGATIDIAELRAAVAREEIVPYFQPKYSVQTGKIVGAEALARWRHPERGLVMPGSFIALAERHALIGDLTWSLLRATLDETARLRRLVADFRVAVNLSADLISDLTLPDRVADMLAASGLDADALTLEITESKLLSSTAETMEVFGRLRLMGVALSIDDFGTGQANLATLREYPFTELKIDRSFVHTAPSDARTRAGLVSCVRLGRDLGMHIVAEGVETKAEMQLIADLGIDTAQGFLLSRPGPPAALYGASERVSA